MELLTVLKVISYIVWILFGIAAISSTIWGAIFYKKWTKHMMENMFKDKKEEVELQRIK